MRTKKHEIAPIYENLSRKHLTRSMKGSTMTLFEVAINPIGL